MGENRRIIGLTGGIAAGKSTITHYLAQSYQIPILDADVYAREAVAQSSPICDRIFQRYGKTLKTPEGTLNRAKLGDIVFNDPLERQWLESQIHPYVRQRIETKLLQITNSTIILAIPLLFEAKMTDLVTEIWVVTCPIEQQISRLQDRNQLTREQAIARIESQAPIEQKIVASDAVIINDSSLESLHQQIDHALG